MCEPLSLNLLSLTPCSRSLLLHVKIGKALTFLSLPPLRDILSVSSPLTRLKDPAGLATSLWPILLIFLMRCAHVGRTKNWNSQNRNKAVQASLQICMAEADWLYKPHRCPRCATCLKCTSKFVKALNHTLHTPWSHAVLLHVKTKKVLKRLSLPPFRDILSVSSPLYTTERYSRIGNLPLANPAIFYLSQTPLPISLSLPFHHIEISLAEFIMFRCKPFACPGNIFDPVYPEIPKIFARFTIGRQQCNLPKKQ